MHRSRAFRHVLLILLPMLAPGLADAGKLELVSRTPLRHAMDTPGITSWTGRYLGDPLLSADGRYFVFNSFASNLVPGQADRNETSDIFLYDRVEGTMTLVSHAAGAVSKACDGGSFEPVISADGRFVAFSSIASDLAPLGESPVGASQVYLFDRATGAVTLVSRRAGSLEAANGPSGSPQISADGNVIAYFSAATDLLPSSTPERSNIYVYDRLSGATTSAGRANNWAAMSADGRSLAFVSDAPNVVPGQSDQNRSDDIFLWDRITGATTLVSHVPSSALQTGNRNSSEPSLSADGRFVAFTSMATNLVAGVRDHNNDLDVFLYDRLTGAVSLVSRSQEAANVTGPNRAFKATLSANGGAVAYHRSGEGVEERYFHAYVFDRLAGTTTLVTRSARSATQPASRGATISSLSLSANGRYVAFASPASNLIPGQTEPRPRLEDVFLLDRETGVMTLISHVDGAPQRTGNGGSGDPILSADGGWVAFSSAAGNLVSNVKDDVGLSTDVFLWERETDEMRTVSVHPPRMASLSPLALSNRPSLSGDGRFVSFISAAADLSSGIRDENGFNDVFLYDRTTREVTLVSRAHGALASANNASSEPMISRDGNWIVYESRASNLVRGQREEQVSSDVFLWDRIGQRTILVNRSFRSRSRPAFGASYPRGLSADGGVVVFESTAFGLIPGLDDRNLAPDVFLWDRRTGAVTLVSRTPQSPTQTDFRAAYFSAMSPDGNFVAFVRESGEAFLWNRRTGRVEALHPVQGEFSKRPIVSADGRYVALAITTSPETGEGGEPVPHGVFLLDRAAGTLQEVAAPSPGGWPLDLSEDGRHLLFQSGGEGPPGIPDLYLFDRVTGETRLVSDTVAIAPAGSKAVEARLGADGRYVAFLSRSLEYATRERHNVVLYDRTTGESSLVSRSRIAPGQGGNLHCTEISLSATGAFIAFSSDSSDLVPRDFNATEDVFLYSPEP